MSERGLILFSINDRMSQENFEYEIPHTIEFNSNYQCKHNDSMLQTRPVIFNSYITTIMEAEYLDNNVPKMFFFKDDIFSFDRVQFKRAPVNHIPPAHSMPDEESIKWVIYDE